MKILIIHGWMHNAKIYAKLKIELEKNNAHTVELYELPGFGITKAKYFDDIIQSYSNDLSEYLKHKSFDCIIGHSLGGSVVLRAICINKVDAKIVLLSPLYYGINIFILAMPFLWIAPTILKLLKNKNCVTDFIIKLLSLFTINSWECISEDVLEATREADPYVATNLMKEMYKDRWEVGKLNNKISLILGEKDHVISRKKMDKLNNSLINVDVNIIKNIGHTAVLEAFDELLTIVRGILN